MRRLINHVQFEPAGVLVSFEDELNLGMNDLCSDVDEDSPTRALSTRTIDEA